MAKPLVRRSFGDDDNAFEVDITPIARQAEAGEAVRQIAIGLITPNPYQPRTVFEPEALQELADSIAESGIQQPLILTDNRNKPGCYWIVTGGRRYKAASEIVGLAHVPAIVRPATDEQLAILAVVENDQRADLNPVDYATALKRIQDDFGLSLSELAKKTGKPKGTISNVLRLLDLPEVVRTAIKDGSLSQTAAREMLPIASRQRETERLLTKIVSEQLTSRQITAEVEAILAVIENAKVAKSQLTTGVIKPSPQQTPVEIEAQTTAPAAPAVEPVSSNQNSPIDRVVEIAEVAKVKPITGVIELSPQETVAKTEAPKRLSLAQIAANIVPVDLRKKNKAAFGVIFDMIEDCEPDIIRRLGEALIAQAALAD